MYPEKSVVSKHGWKSCFGQTCSYRTSKWRYIANAVTACSKFTPTQLSWPIWSSSVTVSELGSAKTRTLAPSIRFVIGDKSKHFQSDSLIPLNSSTMFWKWIAVKNKEPKTKNTFLANGELLCEQCRSQNTGAKWSGWTTTHLKKFTGGCPQPDFIWNTKMNLKHKVKQSMKHIETSFAADLIYS